MNSKFTKWHVIGNGGEPYELKPNEISVRFNQTPCPIPDNTLIVSNGLTCGEKKRMHCAGQPPHKNFENNLSEIAHKLELMLNAWPSIGLTTLIGLNECGICIRVSSMNLFPSISKQHFEAGNCVAPSAFHNWIGERRVAKQLLAYLDWPDYFLLQNPNTSPVIKNPYALLQSLPLKCKAKGLEQIEELAKLSEFDWKTYTTRDRLLAVEPLFYLERNIKKTYKWWLYDKRASMLMAKIHYRLAFEDQTCLDAVY